MYKHDIAIPMPMVSLDIIQYSTYWYRVLRCDTCLLNYARLNRFLCSHKRCDLEYYYFIERNKRERECANKQKRKKGIEQQKKKEKKFCCHHLWLHKLNSLWVAGSHRIIIIYTLKIYLNSCRVYACMSVFFRVSKKVCFIAFFIGGTHESADDRRITFWWWSICGREEGINWTLRWWMRWILSRFDSRIS